MRGRKKTVTHLWAGGQTPDLLLEMWKQPNGELKNGSIRVRKSDISVKVESAASKNGETSTGQKQPLWLHSNAGRRLQSPSCSTLLFRGVNPHESWPKVTMNRNHITKTLDLWIIGLTSHLSSPRWRQWFTHSNCLSHQTERCGEKSHFMCESGCHILQTRQHVYCACSPLSRWPLEYQDFQNCQEEKRHRAAEMKCAVGLCDRGRRLIPTNCEQWDFSHWEALTRKATTRTEAKIRPNPQGLFQFTAILTAP